MSKLIVKKLHPDATLPTKAHEDDLGYDLYALEDTFLVPGQQQIVKTGISAQFIGEVPRSYLRPGYGNIEQFREKFGLKMFDRSGMAAKNGVLTMAGVIDPGYTGEIGVVMILVGPPVHVHPWWRENWIGNGYNHTDAEIDNFLALAKEGQVYPFGSVGYQVKAGDKITQMVPIQLHTGRVEEVDELPTGERGDAGYGSSGR
jgi:dUTP pyrophosphatase